MKKRNAFKIRGVNCAFTLYSRSKVNHFFTMKKINWYKLAFFMLTTGMLLMQACTLFRPKCDCPHF